MTKNQAQAYAVIALSELITKEIIRGGVDTCRYLDKHMGDSIEMYRVEEAENMAKAILQGIR